MTAARTERRRRKRVDIALTLKIKYEGNTISAKTKNISVLGAYAETDRKVPTGRELTVKLKLPAKEISCAASVFRCMPIDPLSSRKRYGIGIFFRSFSKNQESILAKYITRVFLQEKRLGKIFIRKTVLKNRLKKIRKNDTEKGGRQ